MDLNRVVMEQYKYMMLCAAMLVCLGHGANGMGTSVSPFVATLANTKGDTTIAYGLGSSGIVVGLLVLGHRVMETMGKKVVKLDLAKAFSA